MWLDGGNASKSAPSSKLSLEEEARAAAATGWGGGRRRAPPTNNNRGGKVAGGSVAPRVAATSSTFFVNPTTRPCVPGGMPLTEWWPDEADTVRGGGVSLPNARAPPLAKEAGLAACQKRPAWLCRGLARLTPPSC